MAWEERNGQRYYYRKRRIGRRVVSEYVGSGPFAELQAAYDDIGRDERLGRRQAMREIREQAAEVDSGLDLLEEYTQALTRATLLVAGYHQHKGQWRKKRGG